MRGSEVIYKYRYICIFCDMVRQEISTGTRIVIEDDNFIAFEPFAPRFPFETWILPKKHEAHFENTQKIEIEELATVLKSTLAKIETALDSPPYNYILHTSPFNSGELEYYHWHIEIMPRLTRVAGFEWGTGYYINSVPPESAAEYLRKVDDGLTK